jgi:putative nucleotidyltransferase with HDIG domain
VSPQAVASTLETPELDRAEVTARIQRTFESPSYRAPMLPAVALEVLELSQKTDVDFERVVRLLERDAVLAARVLSISQSAAYASRTAILSLRQAVVRLGLKTLRDVVLEAALHMKVFRVPGFEPAMERLARHSTATAHVIRAVCRRTRVETEYAFLCGLLHDVGYPAALLALSADPQYARVPFEALAPVLDEVHDAGSGLLARLWKLPPQVQRVVATHHDLGRDSEPVTAALVVAEQLVWEAGAGLEPPPPDANPMSLQTPEPPMDGLDVNWTGLVEQARRELGMDDLALGAARAEAFALVAQLGRPKA